MIKGRVTSIETMGLVDGPGIRAVVFFAGCGIRCVFCHNPEGWDRCGGEEVTANEIVDKISRLKPYFDRSGGGVTFSGGEPLLQPEFLTELLVKFRELGIHTVIDTAGVGHGDYERILSLVDLVLYDIKATDADSYREITGAGIERTEAFMKALSESGVPTVVRQVVIPGVNDTDEYMLNLRRYVEENIPTAIDIELLPYHTLGSHKYRELGINEPLADTPQMSGEVCERFYEKYFSNTFNNLEK